MVYPGELYTGPFSRRVNQARPASPPSSFYFLCILSSSIIAFLRHLFSQQPSHLLRSQLFRLFPFFPSTRWSTGSRASCGVASILPGGGGGNNHPPRRGGSVIPTPSIRTPFILPFYIRSRALTLSMSACFCVEEACSLLSLFPPPL
ncbi:hypothetical protein CHARACLAT_011776 [Characodon lateralis]|uniref:Uncharacterized protein n=1 Tax=Characodon lateralis TaxID=208331 RepID=A0ABU7EJP1_9TELE|nr:hypothetical protein [Characodon lateralis]